MNEIEQDKREADQMKAFSTEKCPKCETNLLIQSITKDKGRVKWNSTYYLCPNCMWGSFCDEWF